MFFRMCQLILWWLKHFYQAQENYWNTVVSRREIEVFDLHVWQSCYRHDTWQVCNTASRQFVGVFLLHQVTAWDLGCRNLLSLKIHIQILQTYLHAFLSRTEFGLRSKRSSFGNQLSNSHNISSWWSTGASCPKGGYRNPLDKSLSTG